MTASPTPISTWTPTIAPKTVSKATGAVLRTAIAARRPWRTTPRRRPPPTRRHPRPRPRCEEEATEPPEQCPAGEGGHDRHVDRVVAERSEAAVSEDERLNDDDDRDHQRPDPGAEQDRCGAPPSRWPVVPEATGKFTIWAAKMNAAHTPASGTRRSPNSTSLARNALPNTIAATIAMAAATDGSRNPSGACIPTINDATSCVHTSRATYVRRSAYCNSFAIAYRWSVLPTLSAWISR